MKAALARAEGYIAPNTYEAEAERPTRDMAAEIALLQANSARFFAEDAADEPSEEALVPITCACPKCGEMRMDCLSLDDDIVTCATCGDVYDISPAARLDRVMLDDLPFTDRYALAHPGALM